MEQEALQKKWKIPSLSILEGQNCSGCLLNNIVSKQFHLGMLNTIYGTTLLQRRSAEGYVEQNHWKISDSQ